MTVRKRIASIALGAIVVVAVVYVFAAPFYRIAGSFRVRQSLSLDRRRRPRRGRQKQLLGWILGSTRPPYAVRL